MRYLSQQNPRASVYMLLVRRGTWRSLLPSLCVGESCLGSTRLITLATCWLCRGTWSRILPSRGPISSVHPSKLERFSSLLLQKKLWKLWGHIAALSMGLISGTWEGTRRSRYTLPGAHPSSWHGAAHNRPGHISCSRLRPVASLLQRLTFLLDLSSSSIDLGAVLVMRYRSFLVLWQGTSKL